MKSLKNLILLRLSEIKTNKKSSLFNLNTGPIKVEIIFYIINKRGTIKIDEKDKRTNLLFYTKKYLEENKIKHKDLRKISKAAFDNKLEKKLLAPKFIDQIKNIKI